MPVPNATTIVKATTRQSRPTAAPLADTRETCRADGEKRADTGHAEEQAKDASGSREHEAFGQQLSNDPSSAIHRWQPEWQSRDDARRARQQQVCDIGACDEQHEADRARHDEQQRLHVSDKGLAKRLQGESLVVAERWETSVCSQR
jgi:hypothetical protein